MSASISLRTAFGAALIAVAAPALAAADNTNWPNYREGDFVIADYRFASGETIAELKLHYRTLGTAERNAAGEIVNGVLLLQGNTGTGANWLRPSLADELFKPGQPLDAGRYFIIISAAADRASLPTGSRASSRTTVIATWSTARTGWSPKV
jgi:homoserine O-acetyltransferase